jgi:hypothetical protein
MMEPVRSATSTALRLLASCNAMRILAYIFQIARITYDKIGADNIFYLTAVLFAASNLLTAFYTVAVVSEARHCIPRLQVQGGSYASVRQSSVGFHSVVVGFCACGGANFRSGLRRL